MHSTDINFIIQIIQYETSILCESDKNQYQISQNMEQILSSKINECLQNEKFSSFDISIVYRIVGLSDRNQISSNLLYEFIKKSIEKFHILFAFLDVKKLDDEKLFEMNRAFSNESTKRFFGFLPCDVGYIVELRESNTDLQKRIDDSEREKVQIRDQLNGLSNEKTQLQSSLAEAETQKEQLLERLTDAESEKEKLLARLAGVESERDQLNARITDAESQLEILQICTIEASVKRGLVFSAVIQLNLNKAALDTKRSRCIVSTSNAKSLGADAYSGGEPISLEQTTIDFAYNLSRLLRAGIHCLQQWEID